MDRLEEIRMWHQDVSMRFDDKPSRAHEDRGFLLAEIDRLQAEVERLRAALKRRDTERPIELMSPTEKMTILDRLRAQERQRRATLEAKP